MVPLINNRAWMMEAKAFSSQQPSRVSLHFYLRLHETGHAGSQPGFWLHGCWKATFKKKIKILTQIFKWIQSTKCTSVNERLGNDAITCWKEKSRILTWIYRWVQNWYFVFIFAEGIEEESQLSLYWTELICISIDKNCFAWPLLMHNLHWKTAPEGNNERLKSD